MAFSFSNMNNPSDLPSIFLDPQNNMREEFHEAVVEQPKSIDSVSGHLAQNPRIRIDDPFSTVSQPCVWKSHPSVLDLSANPNSNWYNFSHMHRHEFLPAEGCATPHDQKRLHSTDSLMNYSIFGLSAGQSSKKRGAATENGMQKLIERQRRNDMKRLYSTLASLLPRENLEGKRSVADQVCEAIDYIKHLQTKVKELAKKRDEIMQIQDNGNGFSLTGRYEEKICRVLPFHIGSDVFPSLRVNLFGSGLEVVAQTFRNRIVLSNLLQILEEGGLEVVTADVSTVNDKVFYTLHSKISDSHSFQSTAIYERLWHFIGESMHHAQAVERWGTAVEFNPE